MGAKLRFKAGSQKEGIITQTVSSDELMKFNQKSLAYVLNKDINMKVHSTFSLDNIHEAVKTALTPKINGKVLLRGNAN